MARYFFDIRDEKGFQRDEVGDEFANFEQAKNPAQVILADMVGEELPDGELHRISCDVRDEAGAIVYAGELTYHGSRP